MSRILFPLLQQLNDHATVKTYQTRKTVLFRSISEGKKYTDQVWRRTPKNALSSHDPDDVKSQQQPVTIPLLEEIARLNRQQSMIKRNPSSLSTDTTGNKNHFKRSEGTSTRPSFFQGSPQLEQSNCGEVGDDSTSKKPESLTKLLIETTGVGSQRRPSNIPLHSESSIFDVFQVPEAPQMQISEHDKRSPNAYPLEAVKQYYEILEPIVNSNRFLQKKSAAAKEVQLVLQWLKADEPVLVYDLPTFQAAIKSELDLTKDKIIVRTKLQKELSDQTARFCKHYDFIQQPALALRGILTTTSMCARYGKGLPVEVIWEKIKESGIYHKELLQSLLYVSATFTTGSLRSRRKRRSKYGHLAGIASILDVLDNDEFTNAADNDDVNDDANLVDITDEIAIFHDLLFEPSEQSINIRVKLLVAQGKAKEAEMLLDEHSSGTAELRLRAYNPVLKLFIELNDLSSALRLFRKMKNIPTVHLDADAYMHLIAGIAEKGRFRIGAEPIENIIDLGYSSLSGPGLFDELVEEMAKAIYEIPVASAKRLYNAMASGFPGSGLTETAMHSLKINHTRAQSNELLANRVYIEPTNGFCPRSGVKLRLIHLSQDDKLKMVEKVLQKVTVEQHPRMMESRNGTITRKDGNHLLNFCNWLDQREGRPFTVLVDGANVAYNHQNSEEGRFNYHQIRFMVDYLERLGENPLVILPSKYGFSNSFNISLGAPGYFQGARQYFSQEEVYIRDTLNRFGKLFFVPGGTLDDFYWIVSTVSSQTISRRGKDISVPHGNSKGRWPGTRPVIITNDQMRDHQLDLLDPFLFRRWFSNYIVNYNFAAFVGEVCTHPDIGFTPADFFSREIQGSKDENGSTIWHFPISNTEHEWFCCRIPTKNDSTIKFRSSVA